MEYTVVDFLCSPERILPSIEPASFFQLPFFNNAPANNVATDFEAVYMGETERIIEDSADERMSGRKPHLRCISQLL